MNPSLFLPSLRILLAATLLSGLAPGPASAQTKAEAPPAAAGAPVRLDIDFPQPKAGSKGLEQTPLKTAVDLLLANFRAAGQPVNVIFKDASLDDNGNYPALAVLLVPPISLRQVTFEQAIQALVFVTKPAVALLGDAKLFVIEKKAEPTKLRVINVSAFLHRDGMQRRDDRLTKLRSAIAKGISLGQVLSPQLELDDDSGLLFATGSPEALEVVTEVTRALCEPPQPSMLPPAIPAPLHGAPAP